MIPFDKNISNFEHYYAWYYNDKNLHSINYYDVDNYPWYWNILTETQFQNTLENFTQNYDIPINNICAETIVENSLLIQEIGSNIKNNTTFISWSYISAIGIFMFVFGFLGLCTSNNTISFLLNIELITASFILLLTFYGILTQNYYSYILCVFILSITAAEVVVVLSIFIKILQKTKSSLWYWLLLKR
jgi:NADH:ubiquinone oxidoreductase subunit K